MHQAGKLSEGLRSAGAEPVEVPLLEIRPPISFDSLDAAIRNIHRYDWLILTSANTVRALGERSLKLEIEFSQLASLRVAAVGEATAEAARGAGFHVAFVPEAYLAEGLIDGLACSVARRKVLLARAEVARDLIPDELRQAGAEVDVVDAYRNVMPERAPEMLRRAVAEGIDAATFTSSSSVTHLAEAAGLAGIAWPLAGVPAISIGPITSGTLRGLGWKPAVEANPSDIPGLIAAVGRFFQL